MAKFVKRVGKVDYYEIDNFRAGGLLPYFIKDNKVYILINKEFRYNKVVFNSIGGRVDKFDRSIYDTMFREFNEETGFLVSDIIKNEYKNMNLQKCIKVVKSKFLLGLIKVPFNNTWKYLPHTYHKMFKNVEAFNCRESINLYWIDLFNFKSKKVGFLLKILLYKLKNHKLFRKYGQQIMIPDDDI